MGDLFAVVGCECQVEHCAQLLATMLMDNLLQFIVQTYHNKHIIVYYMIINQRRKRISF